MAFFQPTEVRSRHLVSPVCLEDDCLHVSGSKFDPSESFKDPTLAPKKLMHIWAAASAFVCQRIRDTVISGMHKTTF